MAAVSNAELQANEMLRGLIKDAMRDQVVSPNIEPSSHGTHSCKRTTLHWIAVAGFNLDERRLLGHHVIRSDGSWMAYSRDALTVPMERLRRVVRDVMSGALKVYGSEEASDEPVRAGVGQQPEQPTSPSPSLSESSSGCSTSDTDDSTKGLDMRTLQLMNAMGTEEVQEGDGDYEPWVHKKTGTVHVRPRRAARDKDTFLCGRLVGDRYDPAGAWSLIPKCHVCFAGVPDRDQ